ncbi:hypothetical protein [Gilvimarinus agarilyticus]|uniref:hypothetical protein n=1 Tax=Gilvimarinus agarilyticus TaxID=679259 RepID=UPI0012FC4BA3|nr:hypothetical protein [Gilvimarinus agarilyticus]
MLDILWERHKSIWSWYMRPLFGFVLFYGAWLNDWFVLMVGFIGLSTSWFWFPKPKMISPLVEEFINIERSFLTPPWHKAKVGSLVAVLMFVVISIFIFWYRWLELGLVLMCVGGLAKSFWSFKVAGRSGYIAAFFGFFWAGMSILIYMLYSYS